MKVDRISILLAAALLPACGGSEASDEPDCGGSGTICTWAGSGKRAFDGDGKPALDTALYNPLDLEFAPDGTAYVLDWQNHRVRRIAEDDTFETVIGDQLPGDGPPDLGDLKPPGAPGTTVQLNHPTDLAFTKEGKLLLAAWHNHKIRQLDPETGLVVVLSGGARGDMADNVPAGMALLAQPKAVAVSSSGEIFIADSANQRIRKIDAAGMMTTVAGTVMPGFAGDGKGPLEASFNLQENNENPEPGGGIALDGSQLYIADTGNHRIRVVDLKSQRVDTIAGTGKPGFSGDGGKATAAQLNAPRDIEVHDGKLYIADTDNDRIRVMELATGVIRTLAGTGKRGFSGDGGPATEAQLARPFGIAFDADGVLYIADTLNDRIRRIEP
jgi:hypothetical protein